MPWLFLLIALAVPNVEAKDVTLSFDPSPTPSVTSYTLYWDSQPTTPFNYKLKIGDVLTFQIVNLPDEEQHWFAVTASDALGNESAYSNIVKSDAINVLPELDLTIDWQFIIEGNE